MRVFTLVAVCAALTMVVACAPTTKEAKQERKQAVNCATAEGDLRNLENEKVHVAGQLASGVTDIAPAGIVLIVPTGTKGDKLRVATGEYDKQIEAKIAEIKRTCNL